MSLSHFLETCHAPLWWSGVSPRGQLTFMTSSLSFSFYCVSFLNICNFYLPITTLNFYLFQFFMTSLSFSFYCMSFLNICNFYLPITTLNCISFNSLWLLCLSHSTVKLLSHKSLWNFFYLPISTFNLCWLKIFTCCIFVLLLKPSVS